MKQIYLFLLILVVNFSFSQNLVDNPSFEKGMCPKDYSQIMYARGWKGFSSDYFKSCPKEEKYLTKKMSTPENSQGYQKPRTGIAYAGLVTPKELLQTKLMESLKKDSIYYVEFFVNLSDSSSYAIWDIGVYLSNISFDYNWGSDIYDTIIPQIRNPKDRYLTNTILWTKISGFYKAKGNEKYLTISSFNKSSSQEIKEALIIDKNRNRKRYYYIDDVYIGNVPKKLTYTIHSINYKTNEYTLQSETYDQFDIIVDYLQKEQGINILIKGFTDNVGNEDENINLSNQRAIEIKNYLIKKGIDENRINTIGMGSLFPISKNNTREGRQENRRIEISFGI